MPQYKMTDYVINMVLPANMINDRFAMAKEYYKYLPDDRDYIVRSTHILHQVHFRQLILLSQKIKRWDLHLLPVRPYTIARRTNSKGKLAGFINMFYTHGGNR